MGVVSQCTNCNKFLLSSEHKILEKHYNLCKKIPEDFQPDLDQVEKLMKQNENFHWRSAIRQVSFPEVRIHLSKLAETDKLSTSRYEVATQDEGLIHQRSKRVKSQSNIFKISKINQKNKRSNSLKSGVQSKRSKSKANETKKKLPPTEIFEPHIRQFSFHCSKCPAKFYDNFEYKRHVNVHNGSRKLISCVVCTRIFNRRDSLNAHLIAHEVAEEKEQKLDLLNKSPIKFMIRDTTQSVNSRYRLFCKYCLMSHTNHESFLAHHQSEHSLQFSKFPCRYDCDQVFTSIKDLLSHAKSSHTEQFHGKLTYFRMTNGIFTGKHSGRYIKVMDRLDHEKSTNAKTKNCPKKTLRTRISKKTKKIKNRVATDSEDSDDFDQTTCFSTGTERRPNKMKSSKYEPSFSGDNCIKRSIEIERVSIIHQVIGDVNNLQVEVEPQNGNRGQEIKDIVVKVEPADIHSESEPILLNIKTECI